MKPYKDETTVIHRLENLLKFILRGHHLVVSVLLPVSVESFGSVHDQRVEENMSYLRGINPYQSGFDFFIFSGSGSGFLRILKLLVSCKESDCSVIVVACSQTLRLVQQILELLLLCKRLRLLWRLGGLSSRRVGGRSGKKGRKAAIVLKEENTAG